MRRRVSHQLPLNGMSSMTDIPKNFNVFWGGGTLSFMNLLTVISFHEHNPDWKINLFRPKVLKAFSPTFWGTKEQSHKLQCKDHFNDLVNLDFVNEIQLEYDFLSFGYHHPVIKSDMARYKIMSTYGGIWSDFDIIYINSVDKLINKNNKYNLFISYDEYHSIGFYISTKNNAFFLKLGAEVEKYKKSKARDYQYFGRHFVENFFEDFESLVSLENCVPFKLSDDIVYPINFRDLSKITSLDYEEVREHSLTEDTLGIHWFNGDNSVRQKIDEIDKEYKSDKTLMGYYYNRYEEYINN